MNHIVGNVTSKALCVNWSDYKVIIVPQNSLNISVVMATGGSVTASVIGSELVTMETPLNEISTLITVS